MKLVEQFELQRQHFFTSNSITQFRALFSVSVTSSKLSVENTCIKIALMNFWGNETIDDLIQLVALFGVSRSCIHLFKGTA